MKHKFISKRYWKTNTTPMGEVLELAHKYDDIINLSLGDPDFITDSRVITETFNDAEAGHTRYTDSLDDYVNKLVSNGFYHVQFIYKVHVLRKGLADSI